MASLGLVAKLRTGVSRHILPIHSALKRTSTPVGLRFKAQPRKLPWGCHGVAFSSTLAPSTDVHVEYKHGRPVLALRLPSRREQCLFFLRPMLMSVRDLIQDIQREDPGVTSAAVLSTEGETVACTTSIDTLLNKDFQLRINDVIYNVHSAPNGVGASEHAVNLEDMKNMVQLLHSALHLPGHHLQKERELLERLNRLQQELTPLEQMKNEIASRAEFRSSRVLWYGLALLSVQGGALAWLTWWVYSWDVMEPVTYFITYATSIGVFAYYVLTKQDYVYPEAKDRQFLHYFYKGAKRHRFNVQRYNRLKEELALVEEDLRRLRNPNQLQLPLEQIQPKN
ncbi:calcium uniporter protein, mitochondrial isoform X2 [Chanos chanos]|uniref:Calcium uniporter protein n=1 Tax=Chanos chanos TaxID=29144 RepID=A0A6J2WHN7_CHACN|nr:calcium uniporter protein, mitochondrial-like isoform X2 [Chanos chanos]